MSDSGKISNRGLLFVFLLKFIAVFLNVCLMLPMPGTDFGAAMA